MKLDAKFYEELNAIPWFMNCGTQEEMAPEVFPERSREQALSLLASTIWADVRTKAQGDLTGYLAKNHYTSYGGYWNNLAKESRLRLEAEFLPKLLGSLRNAGLPDISNSVLLDVNRAALETVYADKFRSAPRFFSSVMNIYRSGHLPCGWTKDLRYWPNGEIISY